jgi:phosphoribosylaminoimidazolecarboxamide formyltransferase/IMP cyclohydrolase
MTEELKALGYPWIDLVYVGLYPLEEELANPNCTLASVMEKTDIGGPTMLESAAKGGRVVMCDEADEELVTQWLDNQQPDEAEFRRKLAAKATARVAVYRLAGARYLSRGNYDGFVGEVARELGYAENRSMGPAHLLRPFGGKNPDELAISNCDQVAGVETGSINNTDYDGAIRTLTHIAAAYFVNFNEEPCIAVAVKHGVVCGVGVSHDTDVALIKMADGDPDALFGATIVVNFFINGGHAKIIREHGMDKGRRVVDTVWAPSFTDAADSVFERKDNRCRLMVNPALAKVNHLSLDQTPIFRMLRGGDFLRQQNYVQVLDLNEPTLSWLPNRERFLNSVIRDVVLATAICRTTPSNTISLVGNEQFCGNGAGQVSRVRAVEVALDNARKARHDLTRLVACSDSFFPFKDAAQKLIEAGVQAIFTTYKEDSGGHAEVRDTLVSSGMPVIWGSDALYRMFCRH